MNNCIKCNSSKTSFFIGDDGHFRKKCKECWYISGPFISTYIKRKLKENEQEDGTKESIFDY